MIFESNLPELKDISVSVHYEIFDNIPTICKWVSVENKGNKSLKINLCHFNYTGLSDKVLVREKEGKSKSYTLNRNYEIEVDVTIPTEVFTWLILE